MDKPKAAKRGISVRGPMQGRFALSIRQRVSLSIVGLLSVSYGVILFSTDFIILRDRLQRHERLVMATAEAIVRAARSNASRIRTQVDIARSVGTSVRTSMELS